MLRLYDDKPAQNERFFLKKKKIIKFVIRTHQLIREGGFNGLNHGRRPFCNYISI